MSRLWEALEAIDGQTAAQVTWQEWLGEDFDLFAETFLEELPETAESIFCAGNCGCAHTVVKRPDGSIVGVCECPEGCSAGDMRLTEEMIAVYGLQRKKLGRAVVTAFGFQRRESDLGVEGVTQIGAYQHRAIPVLLTIQNSAPAFKETVARLAGQLPESFILFVPTDAFLDADCRGMLKRIQAGCVLLNQSVALQTNGILKVNGQPRDWLTFIPAEADTNSAVELIRKAWALAKQLDGDFKGKSPLPSKVLELYCDKNMSLSQIAHKCDCSKGTVINRKRELEKRLDTPLNQLRGHSTAFEKVEAEMSDKRAKRIHRRSFAQEEAEE